MGLLCLTTFFGCVLEIQNFSLHKTWKPWKRKTRFMNPQISTWKVHLHYVCYMHTVHVFPSYTNIHDSSNKARHSMNSRPSQKRNLPLVQTKTTKPCAGFPPRFIYRTAATSDRSQTKTTATHFFREQWRRRLDFCVLATYLGYCYGIGWDGLGVCSCHARGGSGTYVMRMTRRYRNEPIQLVLLKPAAIW